MSRPPLPLVAEQTAIEKGRIGEDAWNSCDPARVALAHTIDSQWRNRAHSISGRRVIEAFLGRRWTRQLDCRLLWELWAFTEERTASFAGPWGAEPTTSPTSAPSAPEILAS
jgi:nuclear transport factor 2 (NTF2) superfamily protein